MSLRRSKAAKATASVFSCSICKQPQHNLKALENHCQTQHTKKQMIQGLLRYVDLNKRKQKAPKAIKSKANGIKKTMDNSKSLSITKKKLAGNNNETNHNYNFRTPSTLALKQANNNVTPSTPGTPPDSDSKTTYYLPETKRPRKRNPKKSDAANSDSSDTENVSDKITKSKSNVRVKLDYCNSDAEHTICSICNGTATADIILDSDTDSCSDICSPSVLCPFCSNGYKCIDNLEQHMVTHNTNIFEAYYPANPTIKIFVCYFCDEEFAEKEALRQHINNHMDNDVISDIVQMEQEYDNEKSTSNMNNYYALYVSGFNFGVSNLGNCTNAELQIKFYESVLKYSKPELEDFS